MLQAVHMMGVPVTKVFDFRMTGFDFPEHLFLVLAILEETNCRTLRLRARFDDASNMDRQLSPAFLERPDYPPPGLVLIESIAFFKNLYQSGFWYMKPHFIGRVKFHRESPFPQIRQPSWGWRLIR